MATVFPIPKKEMLFSNILSLLTVGAMSTQLGKGRWVGLQWSGAALPRKDREGTRSTTLSKGWQ